MKRRKFIQASTVAVSGASFINPMLTKFNIQEPKFNLKFAPHTGMFENLAGKDPID